MASFNTAMYSSKLTSFFLFFFCTLVDAPEVAPADHGACGRQRRGEAGVHRACVLRACHGHPAFTAGSLKVSFAARGPVSAEPRGPLHTPHQPPPPLPGAGASGGPVGHPRQHEPRLLLVICTAK